MFHQFQWEFVMKHMIFYLLEEICSVLCIQNIHGYFKGASGCLPIFEDQFKTFF